MIAFLAQSVLNRIRTYKRISTTLAALVAIGVLTAGFMVVSGRAQGLTSRLPASITRIFASRTTARTAPALRASSVPDVKPLAPLAANTITSFGTAFTENFDGIGSSATASLPTAWRADSVNGTQTTVYATAATATTQAAGTTGTGVLNGTSAGGFYNFANGVTASSTERAIGWLGGGSYTSPRQAFLQLTNNTGGTINSLVISYDIEKYRSGSRAWTINFFSGTDGSTWTAQTAGDQAYAADANNTVISNPPTTTERRRTSAKASTDRRS